MANSSEHVDHLLAAVIGVADEALADRIDDEIQSFQRNLADENGTFVGYLGRLDDAVASLDGQANRPLDAEGEDAGRGPCSPSAAARQPQLRDQTPGNREHRSARIDQRVGDFNRADISGRKNPFFGFVGVLQVFDAGGNANLAHRQYLHDRSPSRRTSGFTRTLLL